MPDHPRRCGSPASRGVAPGAKPAQRLDDLRQFGCGREAALCNLWIRVIRSEAWVFSSLLLYCATDKQVSGKANKPRLEDARLPLFEYRCLECGRVYEVFVQRVDPTAVRVCPGCGTANVERLFSAFATHTSGPGGCGTTPDGIG